MPLDPTERFSSRTDNYVRYRPGSPAEVLELMKSECGLRPHDVIADIASGTGIFTRMLLENGNRVFAVEPNAAMRQAADKSLTQYKNLASVNGRAEATTLFHHTMDFVTAAQAAHWFDREKARQEFARILKPEGWCVLIWNSRRTDSPPFLREYENLLSTYGSDYQRVRHEHTTDNIHEFFASASVQSRDFAMQQEFDYQGLEGRLLSSSYTPQAGDPKYEPMLHDLRRIFDTYQQNGRVVLEYVTHVYYSQLSLKSPSA